MKRITGDRAIRYQEHLRQSTLRDFSGGLNVVDNDINMPPKFARRLTNVYRANDGGVQLRYGTRLFADVSAQLGNVSIVGMEYYNDRLVVAGANGRIVSVTANGTVSTIWNDSIAGAASLYRWGTLTGAISTTNTSTTVTITHANHSIPNGTNLTISGLASPINAIPAAAINGAHVINVTSNSTYTFAANTAANTTESNVGGTFDWTYLYTNVTGWGTSDLVTMAQFNGDLVMCNGSDKPTVCNSTFAVTYLQDLGTGSNVNTPIAKYVKAFNNYVVMAGDPVYPSRIHISNKNTSGTWYGDPTPNDATYIELGTTVTSGDVTIRGLNAFRDKLVVGFTTALNLMTFGVYNGTSHVPTYGDTIELYGTVAHRSMQTLGDDMLFADLVGVPSINRTLFTGSIRPNRVSELVDPAIQEYLDMLSLATMENRVFAVYNQKEGQYMLFVPDNDVIANTTETPCFVYTSVPTLNIKSWAIFRGWNFTAACRSLAGRVFFGDADGKIWVYGTPQDEFYVDYKDDASVNNGSGVNITFDWELPWADFNSRGEAKQSKYIKFDSRGTANFTAKMYVDNILTYTNNGTDNPTLSMDFVGGESQGFGGGNQPYGGGRRAVEERLWVWPSKFNIMKLRFQGAANEALKFIAITLMYVKGSIRR